MSDEGKGKKLERREGGKTTSSQASRAHLSASSPFDTNPRLEPLRPALSATAKGNMNRQEELRSGRETHTEPGKANGTAPPFKRKKPSVMFTRV